MIYGSGERLKYAINITGGQFVLINGTWRMQEYFADS